MYVKERKTVNICRKFIVYLENSHESAEKLLEFLNTFGNKINILKFINLKFSELKKCFCNNLQDIIC